MNKSNAGADKLFNHWVLWISERTHEVTSSLCYSESFLRIFLNAAKLLLLLGFFGKSFRLNDNDHMGGSFFVTEGMTKATREACYEGIAVQDFRSYIQRSREHEAILRCVTHVLHREFNRYRRTDGGRVCVLLNSSDSLRSKDAIPLELP